MWLYATRAAADEGEQAHEPEVFRYVEPVGSYPLRAALEELGILGLGAANYFSNHSANSSNLEYGYNIDDFGEKITSGYAFDSNRFDTNFLTHPGAGTLYYWAARTNRLSLPLSFLYTLAASTTWEILGEFQENTSINDVFITPIAGLVLGETTVQLGALFDRSCDTTANQVFGWVWGPFKRLHDVIDGAELLRDTECTRLGISRRGDHELRLSISEGVVVSASGPDQQPFAETSLALRTRVVALRDYGTPGQATRGFADGNWTELWAHGAFIGLHWSDFTLGADLVPIGLHFRDLSRDPETLQVTGDEVLFGLLIGTEYVAHRYDGGAPKSTDRYYAIDAPGAAVRYRHYAGRLTWDLELKVSPTFGGIETFAYLTYLRGRSIEVLGTVTRRNGYDYVGGLTIAPRMRLTAPNFEIGADLKAIQLWGIAAFDRIPGRESQVAIKEALRRANAWIALGPLIENLYVRLWASALQRWGAIAHVEEERTEIRFGIGADAVF